MRRLSRFASRLPTEDDVLLGGGVGLVGPVVPGANNALAAAAQRPAAGDAPRPRRSSLGFARKVLLSLLGFAVISSAVGGSMMTTHSSFTASIVNPGNTFAAGTLTMTNDAGSCSGVVASACGALTYSGGSLNPGSTNAGHVAITNSGTLPATLYLSLQNPQTTDGTGNGTLFRSYLNLTVTKDSADGTCVYGLGTSSSYCPTSASFGSGTYSGSTDGSCPNTCAPNFPTSGFPSSGPGISLTGSGGNGCASCWAPGESHTFYVTAELDQTASSTNFSTGTVCAPNCPTASIDFVWQAEQ